MQLKKKKDKKFNVRKKVPMDTKPMGGGRIKALVAGPLRKKNCVAQAANKSSLFSGQSTQSGRRG